MSVELKSLAETDQNAPAGNQQQQSGGAAHAAGNGESNSSNRPEGLADDFWDAEKNEVKLADLIKGHGDLSKFKADADAKAGALPKTEGDYKLPEKLVIDEETAKLIPEGQEVTIDDKSPLMNAARAFAHKAGLSNEDFGSLVQLHIRQTLEAQANETKTIQGLIEAEDKKLGANGPARKKALADALHAKFGEQKAKAILSNLWTADQHEVLETLVEAAAKGGNVVTFDPKHRERGQQGISDEDYEKMTPAQRLAYARQHSQQKTG